MLCFVSWGEPTKRYQIMGYYDLIEYLSERFWFEKILSTTSITSTMEVFLTLANSCHKGFHLRCWRGSCYIVSKPHKTVIGVCFMISTTSLYFCILSITLAASNSRRLNPWIWSSTQWSLKQNLLIPSQNLNPLGYFLLDYLSDMGILLTVIKVEINTF